MPRRHRRRAAHVPARRRVAADVPRRHRERPGVRRAARGRGDRAPGLVERQERGGRRRGDADPRGDEKDDAPRKRARDAADPFATTIEVVHREPGRTNGAAAVAIRSSPVHEGGQPSIGRAASGRTLHGGDATTLIDFARRVMICLGILRPRDAGSKSHCCTNTTLIRVFVRLSYTKHDPCVFAHESCLLRHHALESFGNNDSAPLHASVLAASYPPLLLVLLRAPARHQLRDERQPQCRGRERPPAPVAIAGTPARNSPNQNTSSPR